MFYIFKTEDMDIDMLDKSLDEPINSDDEDYIMRKIREDYFADSTVTISFIGEYSAENSFYKTKHILKEKCKHLCIMLRTIRRMVY